MAFLIFGVSAVMLVVLAAMLSSFADIIDRKSNIKAIFISLLLGGSSALPELTTSFTSVYLDNPDLAAGNVFGSNAFNISILAFMDLIFTRHKTFNHASIDHSYNILLIILLSIYGALAIWIQLPYSFLGMGLDTIFLLILYITGIQLISKHSKKDMTGPDEGYEREPADVAGENVKKGFFKRLTVKQAYIGFFICAALVMVFGSLLTVTADEIAVATGMGATFIGSTLLAAATSLPETTSVINSFRLKNYNLAIGAILGSTTFNFLNLAITDFIYQKGTLFSMINQSHILTLAGSVILYGLALFAVLRKEKKNLLIYIYPSALIIVSYISLSYLLFKY